MQADRRDEAVDDLAALALPTNERESLLERVLIARDLLRLLRRTGATVDNAVRAQGAIDDLLKHCRRHAYALDAGAASPCAELGSLVQAAEHEVHLVNRGLPMDSCALELVESSITRTWLARLARFLAPLTRGLGDTRDRYEFLVTRLLRLRGDIAEPDVLYAVAALNTAVCERLQRQAARARTSQPFILRIVEAEAKVRQALGVPPRHQALRQRFQTARIQALSHVPKERTRTPPAMPASLWPRWQGTAPSRRILAAVAVASVLVLVAAVLPMFSDDAYATTSLRGTELWALSPTLQSGTSLDAQGVLLADVDPLRWGRVDEALRLHEMRLLRDALRGRGLRGAVLHLDGRVVCEIDNRGEVLLWPEPSAAR